MASDERKWTPGPWAAENYGYVWEVYAHNCSCVAEEIDGEADARLIAAAPDLYEALVVMLRVCPEELRGMKLAEYQVAHSALAKAEGK